MDNYTYDAPAGWRCPLCWRVYSPSTPMCFFCGGEVKTNVTGTAIICSFEEYIPSFSEWLKNTTLNIER